MMNEYWDTANGYNKSRTIEQEIFDNNFEKQFEELGIKLKDIPNAFDYKIEDGKVVRRLNRDAIQKAYLSKFSNNEKSNVNSVVSSHDTKIISRATKSSKERKNIEENDELSNNL